MHLFRKRKDTHALRMFSCNSVHCCRFNCQDKGLDLEKAKGKILVCLGAGTNMGVEAIRVGAVGLLLHNGRRDARNEILPQPHLLPAAKVGFEDGNYLYNYISTTK